MGMRQEIFNDAIEEEICHREARGEFDRQETTLNDIYEFDDTDNILGIRRFTQQKIEDETQTERKVMRYIPLLAEEGKH